MSKSRDSVDAIAEAIREDEEARDALAEAVVEQMDLDDSMPEAQGAQAHRREVLKTLGLVGTGAAAGALGGTAATQEARAADTSVGQIGSDGSPVDVALDQLRDPGGDEVFDVDDSGDIVSQRGFEFPSVTTGNVSDTSGNTMLGGVVASDQVTLSSGTALVDTGISATDATFSLALGIDDPDADAKITGRLFWDDSAGTYKVELVEDGTSVGNPTVNYDVVRVR